MTFPTVPTFTENSTYFTAAVGNAIREAIEQLYSPPSINHGEEEGTQTPSYAEGPIHRYTLKGNIKIKKPSGLPSGQSSGAIWLTGGASGHKIETEGFTWPEGEPVWNEAPGALNLFTWETVDGGTTVVAFDTQKGEKGERGAEGYSGSKLLMPKTVPTYKKPSESATTNNTVLAESMPRAVAKESITAATSGTPIFTVVPAKAEVPLKFAALFVGVVATEPANRTHFWIALVNEAGNVVAVTEDFTSATNAELGLNKIRGFPFTSTYEPSVDEALTVVVCECFTGGAATRFVGVTGSKIASEVAPKLSGTTPAGQTTPPAVSSAIGALTGSSSFYAWVGLG